MARIETGPVFLAETPEVFSYDDDGNLLEDGRWKSKNGGKLMTFNFKIILLSGVLLGATLMARTLPPDKPPKLRASEAILVMEKYLNEERHDKLSYIDRIWLVRISEERCWVFSVSNPNYGFEFYRMEMDGKIIILDGDDLEETILKIFGNR